MPLLPLAWTINWRYGMPSDASVVEGSPKWEPQQRKVHNYCLTKMVNLDEASASDGPSCFPRAHAALLASVSQTSILSVRSSKTFLRHKVSQPLSRDIWQALTAVCSQGPPIPSCWPRCMR